MPEAAEEARLVLQAAQVEQERPVLQPAEHRARQVAQRCHQPGIGAEAGELVAREAGAVVGGPVGDVADGDLTWAAAPGLAESFGALVRDLTARHVTRGA